MNRVESKQEATTINGLTKTTTKTTVEENSDYSLLPLPTKPASSFDDVVVVLNTNAKGVTDDLLEAAEAVCLENGGQNVRILVTSTYDQARELATDLVAQHRTKGTKTLVIPVGGDGTLTAMINLLWEAVVEQDRPVPIGNENSTTTTTTIMPSDDYTATTTTTTEEHDVFPFVFGYIAMGTGNALGSVVGCVPNRSLGKRQRARRLWKNIVHPQSTKNEDFRLVLRQLIEATLLSPTKTENCATTTATTTTAHVLEPMDTDIVELPLIRVRTTKLETTAGGGSESFVVNEDQYAFFAGVGYDSLLLQDYKDLQEWKKTKKRKNTKILQLVTTGVAGYTVAMFTRSLPKLLRLQEASRLLKDVKITTDQPESTFWIDHRRGDLMRPTSSSGSDHQHLLYRGSAGIVAAGSVPFYGGGLRLFPFARMTPNGMHLRIGRNLHPLEGILHIPSIFRGAFRDKNFKCLDFVGSHFAIEIYESDNTFLENDNSRSGFPVQHSGEAIGRCTRVEFRASGDDEDSSASFPGNEFEGGSSRMPPPVRFVTLMPSRLVSERGSNE